MQSHQAFSRWADRFLTSLESSLNNITIALQTMPDISDITVEADYTGEVLTGQLPRYVQATRMSVEADVTTLATWSFTVDSGDITATIANGVLEITAIGAESVVTITSDYGGVERSRTFNIYMNLGDPPEESATSFTESKTVNTSFNSTTFAGVLSSPGEIEIEVGSSGDVDLATNSMQVWSTYDGNAGPWNVQGKWQWWNGASWADVGTTVNSNPDHEFSGGGGGTLVYGALRVGTSSSPKTKTGLTPGNMERFRLMCANSSGTRTMYISGKGTATSS